MAAKITSDNQLDQELSRLRRELEGLSKTVQTFMSTFATMPPRERAATLTKVQSKLHEFQRFFAVPRQSDMTNAGTRFTYDSLKSSFLSLSGRWMKFEKTLG